MLNIGVLVSGGGTNLQAIIDRIEDGYLKDCRIAIVVSSKQSAYALERAKKHNLPAVCIPRKEYSSLDDYDSAIIQCFETHKVELVVMAGFLTILGQKFSDKYKNRILNVHPSLIPSFCGKGYYGLTPHIKALEYGVKVTGATVHFVELEADAGPIVLQKAIEIREDDTPETLQKRVMEECEHKILPEAIKLFSENKLVIEGRRVRILS
jgi:phosphoribosylglycinamide formyltransferase-1